MYADEAVDIKMVTFEVIVYAFFPNCNDIIAARTNFTGKHRVLEQGRKGCDTEASS
jgi:hypothetical protein